MRVFACHINEHHMNFAEAGQVLWKTDTAFDLSLTARQAQAASDWSSRRAGSISIPSIYIRHLLVIWMLLCDCLLLSNRTLLHASHLGRLMKLWLKCIACSCGLHRAWLIMHARWGRDYSTAAGDRGLCRGPFRVLVPGTHSRPNWRRSSSS